MLRRRGLRTALRRLPPGTTTHVFAATPTHLGFEEYDVAAQIAHSHHYWVEDGRVETFSALSRLAIRAGPDGTTGGHDAVERSSSWTHEPFHERRESSRSGRSRTDVVRRIANPMSGWQDHPMALRIVANSPHWTCSPSPGTSRSRGGTDPSWSVCHEGCRAVVRFIRVSQQIYAIKETREPIALQGVPPAARPAQTPYPRGRADRGERAAKHRRERRSSRSSSRVISATRCPIARSSPAASDPTRCPCLSMRLSCC